MSQAELLEHLWSAVIDRDEGPVNIAPTRKKARPAPKVAELDLRQVARYARYGAVFDWCMAFDEAGLLPAQWLEAKQRSSWKALADAGPGEPVATSSKKRPRPDAPFADAYDAVQRLSGSGVTSAEIRGVMDRARRGAFASVLAALRENAFGPGDLAGLHESLLSADPSGMEARSGSWPRTTKAKPTKTRKPATRSKTAAPAPLVTLRASHELAFSPDGSRIVAATGGVTDIASGKPLATCALLANTGHVAWSPDGRWITATSTSGKIALCDAVTGARRHVLEMTGEGTAAAFSSDGARVYGGDRNGHVFAWDTATGRELRRVLLPQTTIRTVEWARAHDGLDVIASHRPQPVVLVALSGDLDAKGPRLELPGRTSGVVWEVGGVHALIAGYGWIARMDRAT